MNTEVLLILGGCLLVGAIIYVGIRVREHRTLGTGGIMQLLKGNGDAREKDLHSTIVDRAVRAVSAWHQQESRPPTRVEVGVSPRDYESLRFDAPLLEARVHDLLSAEGITAHTRVLLLETPEVRPRHALVLGVGTDAPTRRFDSANEIDPASGSDGNAWLTVAGVRHQIHGQASVGRLPQNAIRLSSRHTSGVHATFAWDGAHWWVTDSSSNGTWLGSARLESGAAARLQDGQHLRLADVEVVWEVS